jgi:hypothetical protein
MIEPYIVTLVQGHKNKILFSLKQKVVSRGTAWHLEGEKMVTGKAYPLIPKL